ncbi:MaoC-like domain protein [Arthrobacter crystallopoietes BAB-32]|uniref:MaoC-like domain protein n=1 Tax=Arthrobacter crystallopoietes BAB-32 TaxID=1246476 RepID=N1V0I5_9MICC|nr:MaoC/PaaZ C-terminal domain-containing protein [Arthrobacter crystallopoietes]EMY33602.1 MaoC-like domain protein [Arthrobacter crystallopoietes BAB-32]
MSSIEEVRLEELPSLSRLYMSAASTAARSKLGALERPLEVPAARHTVHGIQVSLEHVTRFQHLLQGTVRDSLPSVFVHSAAFPVAMSVLARSDFPLPLLGMVHLSNKVRHLRSIHFSEPLEISAWAENLSGHFAGTQVDLRLDVSSAGETVWDGTSTYLAKGVFLPGLDKQTRPQYEDFIPPRPTATWRLGPEAGREYAGVSGDFNPIHLSSLSARILGLKRSIAHGMYLASRALTSIESVAAERFEWEIGFAAPVFLPATVAVRIEDEEANGRWSGARFVGWGERSHRKHFHGSARAL